MIFSLCISTRSSINFLLTPETFVLIAPFTDRCLHVRFRISHTHNSINIYYALRHTVPGAVIFGKHDFHELCTLGIWESSVLFHNIYYSCMQVWKHEMNYHFKEYKTTYSPLDEIKYVGYLRSSLHPPRYQGSYTSF